MSRYDLNNEGKEWVDEPENVLIDSEEDTATRRRISSIPNALAETKYRRPSPSHPIFGANGIMRGILARRGEKGTMSYVLDPYYNRPNFRVFGHNHCTIGDWWPLQIALMRDGVHGSKGGGIGRGGPNGAVTSIVINGGYKGLDKDNGDTILYSGSGLASETNTDPRNPKITEASKAMQTTHALGKPLRVIRGWKSELKDAPAIGLRYDGLYMIKDVLTSINLNGGAYIRFELERMEGQPVAKYQ